MKLLKLEGYNLTIEPELLTLTPFKKIWTRDRSSRKDRALQELAYIYFMEDPRSDYQYVIDKEARSKAIKEGEGLPETWEPDNCVLEAMEFFTRFKTPSALLLEDTRAAVEKLRKLLRDIDLNSVDDKGKPIYTLNTVTSTIKQIPALVKDLDEAERTLAKEITQSDKVRGANIKAIFEDE